MLYCLNDRSYLYISWRSNASNHANNFVPLDHCVPAPLPYLFTNTLIPWISRPFKTCLCQLNTLMLILLGGGRLKRVMSIWYVTSNLCLDKSSFYILSVSHSRLFSREVIHYDHVYSFV